MEHGTPTTVYKILLPYPIHNMKISQSVKNLVVKLPPDVLAGPLPFPDRLDYAEKLIQEAFDAQVAQLAATDPCDIALLRDENVSLRRALEAYVALHGMSVLAKEALEAK